MRLLGCVAVIFAGCTGAPTPSAPSDPAPRAGAPPAPGDRSAPLPLQGATDLDRVLAETPVVMMGTFDQRITQAWGSALPALDLGDRVMALRVPLGQDLPAPGAQVWVAGRLRLPQAGESMLVSVPVRDGGTLDDELLQVGFTVGAEQILPAAEARPSPPRARAIAGDAELDRLLGARPVRAAGTLVAATSPDGAPRYALLLADDTLVELRIPVESVDRANTLSGRAVTVTGALSLSTAGSLRFRREDAQHDWPVAVALVPADAGPVLAP